MPEKSSARGRSNRVPAVVVGVDGSAGAREALRWALAEGRLRKAPVRAVHAWTFGYIGGSIEGDPYLGVTSAAQDSDATAGVASSA